MCPQFGEIKLENIENHVGKADIAGNQYFLLFPQYFLNVSF